MDLPNTYHIFVASWIPNFKKNHHIPGTFGWNVTEDFRIRTIILRDMMESSNQKILLESQSRTPMRVENPGFKYLLKKSSDSHQPRQYPISLTRGGKAAWINDLTKNDDWLDQSATWFALRLELRLDLTQVVTQQLDLKSFDPATCLEARLDQLFNPLTWLEAWPYFVWTLQLELMLDLTKKILTAEKSFLNC